MYICMCVLLCLCVYKGSRGAWGSYNLCWKGQGVGVCVGFGFRALLTSGAFEVVGFTV